MLKASNLICVRQQRCLFKDLSFELSRGELLLIEGANGCGKSSLLRIIAGLATPLSGTVSWRDLPIQHLREDYFRNMHYLSHTNGIKWGLTVEENLALAGYRLMQAKQSHQETLLAELKLTDYKYTFAQALSAGQKRRLALATHFLYQKPLWLLDEPFTSLDVETQHIVMKHLHQHLEKGGMAVMSSHHAIETNNMRVKSLRLGSC